MSKNILYNVVRDNVPNSPVDDQGLMDIARGIVGSTWPTGINRLRFVGFRYTRITALSTFTTANNEIALLLSLFGSVTYTINGSSAASATPVFGTVFNTITAASATMSIQYALFTYN